jgi:hypothetical protein
MRASIFASDGSTGGEALWDLGFAAFCRHTRGRHGSMAAMPFRAALAVSTNITGRALT